MPRGLAALLALALASHLILVYTNAVASRGAGFDLSSDGPRAIFSFVDVINWDVIFGDISIRELRTQVSSALALAAAMEGRLSSLEAALNSSQRTIQSLQQQQNVCFTSFYSFVILQELSAALNASQATVASLFTQLEQSTVSLASITFH